MNYYTLTTTEQASSTGENMPFCLKTIQQLCTDESYDSMAPAQQAAHTIIWVQKGSGVYMADMDRFSISNNTLYYIKPGQILLFDPEADCEGFVLSFSRDFLRSYEDQGNSILDNDIFLSSKDIIIPIEQEESNELSILVEKMVIEYTGARFGSEEILRGLLKIFLLRVHRQLKHESQHTGSHTYLVKKFFHLLEKNYIRWKMVADYARELAITANYLNEIVKKATGSPVRYHIQQRIIIEAKRKAVHARMTMKEVAYHLGFDDIYHFSKYFKKVSGTNFTDFKKQKLHALMA